MRVVVLRTQSKMKKSLEDLRLANDGKLAMSAELDSMYQSLLNNEVPELWARVAYPSLKPLGAWVKDLHQRIAFMSNWVVNGPPKCFWLSGFFFTQGFMTGVLQSHARKVKKPIDTLNFRFHVLDVRDPKEVVRAPEDGVYVYGLFMDGARWDSKTQCIADSRLGEVYSPVPMIHFIPHEHYVPREKDYACPVYKTSNRAGVLSTTGQSTNFVLAVNLPSQEKSPDYWVLRGAALLLQLDH
jgi:dynein heavy chain